MKIIKEYLLFAFIVENIAAQTFLLGGMTEVFFYIILAFGMIMVLTTNMWTRDAIKTFRWAYVIGLIYLFYQFILMPETISVRSVQYVAAKIITLSIIIICLSHNFDYYYRRMAYPLAVFLCFFIIYSFVTGEGIGSNVNGRLRLGYTNENTLSWLGAMTVGLLLSVVKEWNWKSITLIILAFYGVLAGASRAGMLLLSIIVLAHFGFSKKAVLSVLFGFLFAIYLLPSFGLKTVGVERAQKTIDGIEKSNRDIERKAAEMMIAKKPWTGWGFEAKNEGKAKKISELGSHSGYLETIKFMGYPMGGLWLCVVLGTVFVILVWHHRNKVPLSFFEAYLIALPICAFYEDVFTGVHEIETNFFYISLGISSFKVACMRDGELPLVEETNKTE